MTQAVDVERLVVTALTDEVDATVGTQLPPNWTPTSGAFVRVTGDGGRTLRPGILASGTVRCVAFTGTPSTAKSLAAAVEAFLLTPGNVPGARVKPGTSVQPAKDDTTKAPIAAITVRIEARLA